MAPRLLVILLRVIKNKQCPATLPLDSDSPDWQISEGDSARWNTGVPRAILSRRHKPPKSPTDETFRSCAIPPSRRSAVQSGTAAVTHPGTAAAATATATAVAAPVATNGAVATPMKFSTNFSRMPVQRNGGGCCEARIVSRVSYAKHGYENILDRDRCVARARDTFGRRTTRFLRRIQDEGPMITRSLPPAISWPGGKYREPRERALPERITGCFVPRNLSCHK